MRAPPAIRIRFEVTGRIVKAGILEAAALLGAAQGQRAEREEHMNAVAVPVSETKGKGRRWLYWIGWIVSFWPAYVVCTSAHWKLTHNPGYLKMFAQIGWPTSVLTLLACLQLGSLILFLIPRTSLLGAVLLTGYLGGAIASYVRIQYYFPVVVPLSTSMIAWLGIWLREPRLRQLLPIRFGSLRP